MTILLLAQMIITHLQKISLNNQEDIKMNIRIIRLDIYLQNLVMILIPKEAI